MATVYTAQYRYGGPDRVDITTRRTHPVGAAFAPDWTTMVDPFRKGKITWEEYSRRYAHFLNTVPKASWDWICAQPEVTLVCFCPRVDICHRSLLAMELQKRGCRYAGERIPDGRW